MQKTKKKPHPYLKGGVGHWSADTHKRLQQTGHDSDSADLNSNPHAWGVMHEPANLRTVAAWAACPAAPLSVAADAGVAVRAVGTKSVMGDLNPAVENGHIWGLLRFRRWAYVSHKPDHEKNYLCHEFSWHTAQPVTHTT